MGWSRTCPTTHKVGAGLAPALLKKEADLGSNTWRLAGRKDAEKGRGGGCFYAERRPYRGYLRWLHARRDSRGRYAPRTGGGSRCRRLGQKYAQAWSGPVDGWPRCDRWSHRGGERFSCQ